MPGILTIGLSQNSTENFEPSGAPVVKIFSNFNYKINGDNSVPSFQIKRAYLGYKYSFSKDWSAKIILDVGNPKDGGKYEMAAYLKNAYLKYNKGNLSANFGMISTTQFKVSEKIWGNRYMLKSYQDEYKFNSSADIGINLDYKFTDFISADFSIINGEGYKKVQVSEL